MDGFEFVTALKDEMSAPASAEQRALSSLQRAIDGVGASEEKLQASTRGAGHAQRESKGFFEEFTHALIPQIAAGELLAEALKKVGESVVEAGKFAIEAAEFKENTMLAYEAVRGTAEEGEATFQAIDKLADTIRLPAERAHEIATSLMVQGMQEQAQIEATVTAIANLHRVGPKGAEDKLQTIVQRSLATGHFEIEKRQLGGLGVTLDALAKQLEGPLHKSAAAIKTELMAGKIDAEVGISAITNAINAGKIGEIAKKKFDLTDAATLLHNGWKKMFQDIDVSPLKQALIDFISIFDQGTASGSQMHDVVTDALNAIVKAISSVIDHITIFALEFQIAATNAHIALLPVIRVIDMIVGGLDRANAALGGLVHAGDVAKAILSPLPPVGGGKALADIQSKAAGLGEPTQSPFDVLMHGFRKQEPGHQHGGVVHEPPPGEAFAAVHPGELILPERFATPLLEMGRGGASDNSKHVELHWSGDVNVHNGGDHDEVRQVVTSALADVLEQVALEAGG